jgi:hypothetical protein
MRILAEDLRFRGAIAVGDRLTATVTAREKRPEGAEVVSPAAVSTRRERNW